MSKLPRLLLIAMMLVLLPLRGLTADVMAVDMAANMAASTMLKATTEQSSDSTPASSMPADCAMHTQASGADANAFCNNCDTCELCVAVASLPFSALDQLQQVRYAEPLMFHTSFSSAAHSLALKPPIF